LCSPVVRGVVFVVGLGLILGNKYYIYGIILERRCCIMLIAQRKPKKSTAYIVAYIYKAKDSNMAEVAKILDCELKDIELIEAGKKKYTKE